MRGALDIMFMMLATMGLCLIYFAGSSLTWADWTW